MYAILEEILDPTTIGLILAIIVLFFFLTLSKGINRAINGVLLGLDTFIRYVLIIVLAMVLAGLVQVAIPRELVTRYLSITSGWRGIVIGALIGAAFPGAPYAAIPLFASFIKMGASIPTIVAMLASWGLLSIGRMPFQLAVTGARFTIIYITCVLLLPIVAGFLALIAEKFI